MGISEGLPDGAEVDCSAGTIVWVRRRNGSWWPGKILGTEELSSSHLMSPRSGTPVKLLGREDASVDWYNLEKSKRVKAFRCGEFDDCIERAESSQGIPIKKREKYARREDAILHALELERMQIEKKQQKMGITLNHMSEKVGPSENHWGNNEATDYHKYRHLRSPSHSKISDSSFEEAPTVNGLLPQKRKPARQPSWEDNNSEAVPRMRGLQDFGLRIASSKRKIPSVSLDVNHDHVIPVHVSSNKNSLPIKRKRSQGGPTDEFLVKRRDRRRPLVQVLQSSAKLASCHTMPSSSDTISLSMQGETEKVGVVCRAKRSKCVFLPSQSDDCLNQTEVPAERMQLACPIIEENKSSESSKDEESDSTESDYSDLDVEVEATVLSDPVQMLAVGDPTNSSGSIIKRQPLELEELDEESPLSSYGSQIHSHEQTADISVDVRGSKWQLKGKRNIRNLTKTSVEAQIARYDNRRYSFNMRPSSRDRQRSYHDTTDSDEDSQAGVLVPWEESDEGFNPVYVGRLGSGMDSLLVDVDLKVQASYQGEHVPLVSLMSRLNGKAIIGHPVQVETLEEGSSDHLFSTNVFGEEPLADNDGNAGLPPVWRTARRTAMHRVPHPRPSSALEGKEVYPLQYSDDESKPKPHVGRLNHKVRLMKNYSHAHGPILEKRPLKKLSKKVSLLSQKTRTLSSIAIEQRSSDPKSANKNGGLIKPEEMAPSIACVPVKLVFSRILEGIGKPSFKAVSKPS